MRRRSFLYGGLGTLAACTQPESTDQVTVADEKHQWHLADALRSMFLPRAN
jgi:hypothetical protein